MAQPWEQDWSKPNAGKVDDESTPPWERKWGVAPTPKKPEATGILRSIADIGVKGAQGVVDLGSSVVGLASLATGGAVGQGMRAIGYDPEATNKALGEYLSPAQQEAEAKVQAADGFVDTLIELARNPRAITGGIAQSLPGVFALGGIQAKAAEMIATKAAAKFGGLATEAGAAAAKEAVENAAGRLMWVGAAGEGLQTAGQQADQAQGAGREYGQYALPALAAGAGTALIGRAAGKLMGDAETSLFTGAKSAGVSGNLPTRVGKSIFSEGFLEEMPQSAQEQIWQNIGMGKPWDEGVGNQAATGLVTGAALGGSMAALQGNKATEAKPDAAPKPGVVDVLAAPSVDDAIETFKEAVSGPVKAGAGLPNVPGDQIGVPIKAFGDRVLNVREQLADPETREKIRAALGPEALDNATYYATAADTAADLPDLTRDRMIGVAEGIIERALFKRESRPGVTGDTPAPQGMLSGPAGTPLIGLDTAETGVMRVDEQGNAAPETRADIISERQPRSRPDGMEQQVQGRPLPRDGVMVGDGTLTTPERKTAAPAENNGLLLENTIQPGDIKAKDGEPFVSKTGAQARAFASGGGKVVPIPDHFGSGIPGYVVRPLVQARPNNTRGTNADDVARPDGQRPADAGRGQRAVVLPDGGPSDVLPSPAGAAGQGVAGPGAAGGGAARTNALTVQKGLTVSFGGKSYPVKSINDAQEKWVRFRDSADGGMAAGVSQVGNGVRITDSDGKFVARISYNGRAWDSEDVDSARVLAEAPDGRKMPQQVLDDEAAGKSRPDTSSRYLPPKETLEEVTARSTKARDDLARTVDAPTLTEGQRVTLNGTPYTVTFANNTAVKLQGADGITKMVATNSRTFQAIQREPNEAARPQAQAAAGESAAPAAAPAPAAPAVVPGAGPAETQAGGVKDEPWKLTREQAAKDYPGDEYDRMLNRSSDLGDIPYAEADRRARTNAFGQRKLWAKTRAQLEQEGKDAVKAARGDRAATNKLKGTPEFANWRLKVMSLKGKEAIAEAERLARDYLAIHKDRVQEALMEGKDVPAEVLADYPDLKRPGATPNATGTGTGTGVEADGLDADSSPEERAMRSGDFKEMLRLRNERQQRDVKAVGDMSQGGVLRHEGGKRYVLVLPDVDGGGKWRIQRFDKDGFSGHEVFNDQAEATQAAINEGFKTRDDGALDAMQATPAWDRGMAAADIIRRVNGKEISFAEGNRLLAEYDAKQKPAAKDDLPVKFKSTDGTRSDYGVYVRRVGQEVRVSLDTKTGEFSGINADITAAEKDDAKASVRRFIRKEAEDQIKWFESKGMEVPADLRKAATPNAEAPASTQATAPVAGTPVASAPSPAPERTPKAQAVKEALAGKAKPLDVLAEKLNGADMSARPIMQGGRRVVRVVNQKQMNSALSIVADGDGFKVVVDNDTAGGLREKIAARLAEVAPALVATHKDPGEPAEPVTPAVVREAIKTGVQATDRKPSAMKAELLAEIDEAVKEAPDYMDFQAVVKTMGLKDATAVYTSTNDRAALGEKAAPNGYSRPTRMFRVEGDGVFTVNNTVRQLLTFRAKVESSPGFKDRQAPAGLNERATDALDRRSTDAAIANMVDEGDFQAALDYAEAKDVDIANVKLTKVLRDRLEKWRRDTEMAAKVAEFEARKPEDGPAPGSLAAAFADKEAQAAPAAEPAADAPPAEQAAAILNAAAEPQALTLTAIPKNLQITLELEGEDGKTQKKLVNARKAFLAATQRVEKLRALKDCVG